MQCILKSFTITCPKDRCLTPCSADHAGTAFVRSWRARMFLKMRRAWPLPQKDSVTEHVSSIFPPLDRHGLWASQSSVSILSLVVNT